MRSGLCGTHPVRFPSLLAGPSGTHFPAPSGGGSAAVAVLARVHQPIPLVVCEAQLVLGVATTTIVTTGSMLIILVTSRWTACTELCAGTQEEPSGKKSSIDRERGPSKVLTQVLDVRHGAVSSPQV